MPRTKSNILPLLSSIQRYLIGRNVYGRGKTVKPISQFFLLQGISKNSLFAIFQRLQRVVTRWIIASYNIAFLKLPLKTSVFRGSLDRKSCGFGLSRVCRFSYGSAGIWVSQWLRAWGVCMKYYSSSCDFEIINLLDCAVNESASLYIETISCKEPTSGNKNPCLAVKGNVSSRLYFHLNVVTADYSGGIKSNSFRAACICIKRFLYGGRFFLKQGEHHSFLVEKLIFRLVQIKKVAYNFDTIDIRARRQRRPTK